MKRTRLMRLALFIMAGGISFFWLCLNGFGQLTPSERDYHNNIVVILDASFSMIEHMADRHTRKMDAAQSALREVLNDVPQETQIGLLVFGAENIADGTIDGTKYGWAYRLGPRDDRRLVEAINSPRPRGQTPLGACIGIAYRALLEQRAKQRGGGTYRLLIVTDGQADDPNVVEKYVSQATTNGIVIDVIGVGMKERHILSTKAHRYYRADDPASLKNAVIQVFAEVKDVASDEYGKNVFDVIAPIPDKVAAAMIEAVTKKNQEQPKPKSNVPNKN